MTSTVHNIYTFAVLCLVTQPFFVASLMFMKGSSYSVIGRNFKYNQALRSCYGKFL